MWLRGTSSQHTNPHVNLVWPAHKIHSTILVGGTMQQENRLLRLAILFLCLFISTGCTGSKGLSKSDKPTTVILIRHAERDNFFKLTDQGRKRANELVDAVKNMGITAIYSPDLERNLDTVKPLVNYLEIGITLTPKINKQLVDKIANGILTEHSGETVLLDGNGFGNLRALHQRLGGKGDGPYQYGDMFIYSITDKGPVKVIKSRYGAEPF
jgi:hypothetical protein